VDVIQRPNRHTENQRPRNTDQQQSNGTNKGSSCPLPARVVTSGLHNILPLHRWLFRYTGIGQGGGLLIRLRQLTRLHSRGVLEISGQARLPRPDVEVHQGPLVADVPYLRLGDWHVFSAGDTSHRLPILVGFFAGDIAYDPALVADADCAFVVGVVWLWD